MYRFAFVLLAICSVSSAQVRLIVTPEPHNPKDTPRIQREDVSVYQGRERVQLRTWTSVQEGSPVQLYFLIDDGCDTSLGSQFSDLKKFIESQPALNQIGVAYMQNGSAKILQVATEDHASAIRALRLPLGSRGIAASSYLALSDLIKQWPNTQTRREVLMISTGGDLFDGSPSDNPNLSRAIDDAQKAGAVVYSIYFGGPGHSSHDFWRINGGQNYLSRLADETGGESFWQGVSNPVSFGPYLDSLNTDLQRQYLLTFQPSPGKSGFQPVRVQTEGTKVDLRTAARFFVPPGS